jgi:hypothetical protein
MTFDLFDLAAAILIVGLVIGVRLWFQEERKR